MKGARDRLFRTAGGRFLVRTSGTVLTSALATCASWLLYVQTLEKPRHPLAHISLGYSPDIAALERADGLFDLQILFVQCLILTALCQLWPRFRWLWFAVFYALPWALCGWGCAHGLENNPPLQSDAEQIYFVLPAVTLGLCVWGASMITKALSPPPDPNLESRPI